MSIVYVKMSYELYYVHSVVGLGVTHVPRQGTYCGIVYQLPTSLSLILGKIIFIPRHTLVAGYYDIPSGVRPSVRPSAPFPIDSFIQSVNLRPDLQYRHRFSLQRKPLPNGSETLAKLCVLPAFEHRFLNQPIR